MSASLLAAVALAALFALAAFVFAVGRRRRRLLVSLDDLVRGTRRLASDPAHRLEVPEEDDLGDLVRALNQFGDEIENHIQTMAAERDHLRAILASMAEGVLVTDARARAQFVNSAFARLFGLKGDVTGHTPLEITRLPSLADLVAETLEQGAGGNLQLELGEPERRSVGLAATPLAGPDGAPIGAVVVARDVTELTRLAEMRRDFVANVSHELKTPLAAIRGYAETLTDGALEDDHPTARRFVERILDQCFRLEALLDDLLTLSRLESADRPGGAPRHESGEVDLEAAIARAVEVVAAAAVARQVTIEPRLAPVPPVTGDAGAIERLLLNLLDNAVKYNRPGGRVEVRLAALDGYARIEVEDTGIGIPREALPRLFERFYRVDKGRARAEGGTGLGLAIVKHVAQAHGGRVEVESEIGRGSTFRVWLPLG